MKSALWLCAAILGLTLAVPPAVHARQSSGDPASNAPFFSGVADVGSLTRAVDGRLAGAREAVAQLLAVTGKRTPDNTLRPFDNAALNAGAASGLASIVRQLHPDPQMRAAAEKLGQAIAAFGTELSLNRSVYDALAAVDLSGEPGDTRHDLERQLSEYRRQGVDKDAATRTKIAGLREQLERIGQEFDRNVRSGGRTLRVASAAELEGLPADFIAAHKPDAEGGITLTTNASDLQPVVLYARSEDLRKRMVIESQNVAYPANLAVLERMVTVRAELAHTLGYADWASYDLGDRMAGTPQNAAAFIDRVVAASGAKAEADYRQLLDRKRQDQPGATVINSWERRYYTELVRQASYNFDSQAMRPYFSYDRVRDGVFSVTGRLFGLEFRPVTGVPVWHPSVETYEVFENNRLVGRIYLDMHPRADKGGGGASTSTPRAGVRDRQVPEVVLICRFPGGQAGDAGLMTYSQVTEFFHEFGHLIHAVSSGRQQWIGLGRVAERDFIEAPSQMLEEWVSDPATLATFAKHYQTNEPIPAALVQQMRRANELGRGYDIRQQMVYAKLSLSLHDRDPKTADAMAIYQDLVTKYLPTPFLEGTYFPASFTQLSNPNYTAAYYTYMWSLVIAKDLFSQFDSKDLLSPAVARRYRETILAQGGAKPAAQLVSDFLGRPFNFTAWETWLNQRTP